MSPLPAYKTAYQTAFISCSIHKAADPLESSCGWWAHPMPLLHAGPPGACRRALPPAWLQSGAPVSLQAGDPGCTHHKRVIKPGPICHGRTYQEQNDNKAPKIIRAQAPPSQ